MNNRPCCMNVQVFKDGGGHETNPQAEIKINVLSNCNGATRFAGKREK